MMCKYEMGFESIMKDTEMRVDTVLSTEEHMQGIQHMHLSLIGWGYINKV